MKKILILLLAFLVLKTQAQTDANQFINLHNISDLSNITNASTGNLLYNTSDNKIYKYDGSNWVPIGSLIDDDKDTYVEVDNGSDNDLVNFTIEGVNSFSMEHSKLEFLNAKGSIYIGEGTGTADTAQTELNVYIGYESGANNTTGYRNTAIGTRALKNVMTAKRNTAVGNKSLYKIVSGQKNVAVGDYSQYDSNGDYNTSVGTSSLENLTSGDNNTGVGYNTLSSVTTGNNNIALGYNADIGTNTNNRVRVGNSSIQYGAMQVAWSVSSDSIWKKDIKPLKYGLDLINKLEVVDYTRKTEDKEKPMGREIGFIAQTLIENLSEVGYNDQGFVRKEGKTYSVRYNDFIPLAIKGIQEQQLIIDELKNENAQLKNKLLNIENRLNRLEAEK